MAAVRSFCVRKRWPAPAVHGRPLSVALRKGVRHARRLRALVDEHHVAVDVRPRVDVEGDEVAVLAGNLPHGVVRAAEAGEARAHHEVVRVVAADGCRGDAEVALGGEAEEVELHLGGGLARHAALLQEGAEGDLGGVRLGLLHHGVEEAGVACAASPPGELVVDEVAEEPGVVLVRRAAAARHVVAVGREQRVEHVREGAARTVLVRTDPEGVVVFVPAEGVAHREEARVDESAALERGIAARAEEVEAPRLQARERVRLPVRLVRELLLVDLVVDAPPRGGRSASCAGSSGPGSARGPRP